MNSQFGRLSHVLVFVLLVIPAVSAGAVSLQSDRLGNVFDDGDAVVFHVDGAGGSMGWELTDFFGHEVGSGRIDPVAGRADIVLPPAGPGYFLLSMSEPGAPDPVAQTALAVLGRLGASNAGASPFGVVTHFAKGWDTVIIPLIAHLGVRHVRDEQPWRKIEKTPGQYRFDERMIGYMAELRKYQLDPLIELVFTNPLYDDDKTPFSDSGRAGYAAYAQAVIARYRAQLDAGGAVEVWNEYNGSFCTGPCKQDPPRFYTEMLRTAYAAIKRTTPEVTVLGGAGVPIPVPFYNKLFKLGALDAMDALVIHPYFAFPERIPARIAELREAMAEAGGGSKPIWATEFSDLQDMRKSREAVARYLVKTAAILFGAGVERSYWYLFQDFEQFAGLGLIRAADDPLGADTPTPAYAAYAALIREVSGGRFVRRETAQGRAEIYLFETPRGPVRVAWSAQPISLELHGKARIVTLMGGGIEEKSSDGSVSLSDTPVYIEGSIDELQ